MTFVELLIITALLTGFAIGKWFEYNRTGGTEQMRCQRDNARRSCDVARAERDQLLALDEPPAPVTPIRGPVVLRQHRRLELVHGESS